MKQAGRMVYVLECHDDDGGLSIGAYSSKPRALVALRRLGRERFARFEREDSEYNPDWHQFTDPERHDGTYYMIVGREIDRHV